MEASIEPLLTLEEVAEIFRVDPKTVRGWLRRGTIDTVRTPGGHRRIRESEVEAFFKKEASK